MPRAPFQVLVIPYIKTEDTISYALFRRQGTDVIQFLAGGGETGEAPLQAAVREAFEEARIGSMGSAQPTETFMELQTTSSIPVSHFRDRAYWPADIYVIPEYSFGVQVFSPDLILSPEHESYEWCNYINAFNRLTFSGNRTALWELHCRLRGIAPRQAL